MTLEGAPTLCFDFHSQTVDIKFLALRGGHSKLYILIRRVIDTCRRPCACFPVGSYEGSEAVNIAIFAQTFQFSRCSYDISRNGCLIIRNHGPGNRKRLASAQFYHINCDGHFNTLCALCGSNSTIELPHSRERHAGIESLDE